MKFTLIKLNLKLTFPIFWKNFLFFLKKVPIFQKSSYFHPKIVPIFQKVPDFEKKEDMVTFNMRNTLKIFDTKNQFTDMT